MWKNRSGGLLALGLATGLLVGSAVMVVTPAGAHVSSWAHNWKKHIKPKTDARYYTKSAARGRFVSQSAMQTGSYFITAQAGGAGDEDGTQISFAVALPSAPVAHFIPQSTTPPVGCSGTPADPVASPGHLCVFEVGAVNAQGQGMCRNDGPITCPGASRFGTSLYIFSTAAGRYQSWGTWAATPGTASPRTAPPKPSSRSSIP